MPGHTRYPLRIAVRAAILAMAPGMAWAQAYGLPQLPTVTVVV